MQSALSANSKLTLSDLILYIIQTRGIFRGGGANRHKHITWSRPTVLYESAFIERLKENNSPISELMHWSLVSRSCGYGCNMASICSVTYCGTWGLTTDPYSPLTSPSMTAIDTSVCAIQPVIIPLYHDHCHNSAVAAMALTWNVFTKIQQMKHKTTVTSKISKMNKESAIFE